ncbi:unnamed protein product [Prorocentrum cordatum]|uniref:Autophagy-related protein 101 n=1 Tax=Prorocentrum cordatum TaxID=2364126 RepID=A0ABN9R175_9DINO|nr:unnamed protein product [Polarella glacialis]
MAQVLVHMVHQFLREVLEVTELLACQVRGIDDGLVSVEHRPLGRHRRPVLVRGVSRQGRRRRALAWAERALPGPGRPELVRPAAQSSDLPWPPRWRGSSMTFGTC